MRNISACSHVIHFTLNFLCFDNKRGLFFEIEGINDLPACLQHFLKNNVFQGSIKKSLFDTFKLATDSVSRSTTKTTEAKIKEKNTWRCPICLGDDYLDGVDVEIGEVVAKQSLPCEHEFHADCLSNYIRYNLKGFACPMCRKLFSVSLVTKKEGKN